MGSWMGEGTCPLLLLHILIRSKTSHYYYRLSGEYSVPMTPKNGWFKRYAGEEVAPKSTSNTSRRSTSVRRPARRRLILSQTMIIEIDSNKVHISSLVSTFLLSL